MLKSFSCLQVQLQNQVSCGEQISRGNKCQFWQIFVEAREEFPNYFIQSKTSASAHEYSVSNRVNKYIMSLSNFWDENRGLSHFSKKWSRHQLVLVPPYEIIKFVTWWLCPVLLSFHFTSSVATAVSTVCRLRSLHNSVSYSAAHAEFHQSITSLKRPPWPRRRIHSFAIQTINTKQRIKLQSTTNKP